MLLHDVGIIGTGLWEGEVITNERYPEEKLKAAEVRDPYRGGRDDSGTVRVAGMEFSPSRHARTIAAIERSFVDPYRGARRRRHFPANLKVSDAETEAARKAIENAGIRNSDIGAILVQSFLPDELQPKNGPIIAHNLGIHDAPAWELDSICNSALTQFTVGASLIHSGFARHVLCIQSVAYSRVMDPNSSSAVQEGDMASAFILGPSPGARLACSWRTEGRLHGAIGLRWGTPVQSGRRPYWGASQERMMNHFDRDLQAQVMHEIAGHAGVVCHEALRALELEPKELSTFICHQPMSWFQSFMDDVLELPDGVSLTTFEEYANVNSTAITCTIDSARRSGRIQPGSKVLLFGPAAGYVFGAIAVEWGRA